MPVARVILCASLLALSAAPSWATIPYGLACSPEERAAYAEQPVTKIRPVEHKTPKYPRIAESLHTEGWVDLLLTVETDGRVSKACVLAAEPEGVFESTSTKALVEWRYNPSDVAALPDPRLKIRMTFLLN
jgi:TonB family protein